MATWKRDFASGLVVLVPIIVTLWVVAWVYGVIANAPFLAAVDQDLLEAFGLGAVPEQIVQVVVTVVVFGLLVLGVGYLMRTAVGTLVESWLDSLINRLPGLRVVYNASKLAAETALTGTESLQTPVKVEPWDGMRLTAFKTGKRTPDGRELLFMPTAPNITTGFVVEVAPENIIETDEGVEIALTRLLSAGFGDEERATPMFDVEGGELDAPRDEADVSRDEPERADRPEEVVEAEATEGANDPAATEEAAATDEAASAEGDIVDAEERSVERVDADGSDGVGTDD